MKMLFASAALMLAAFTAHAADLEISDAFVRASPGKVQNGAGFLTIRNPGAEPDRLIAAEAKVSKTVELHTHIREGEVMRMRQVEFIAIPANGAAHLQPGGDHVMFIGLERPLKEGETVPVTLVFEKAGRKVVEMPVKGVAAMMPGHMRH